MDMGHEIKVVTKITIHQNVDEFFFFFFFQFNLYSITCMQFLSCQDDDTTLCVLKKYYGWPGGKVFCSRIGFIRKTFP